MRACGPGNTHLINGLYDCYRSRVPVLAIAPHVPSREIGSHTFKKHIRNFCSKNVVVSSAASHADQIPRILDIAMRTALSFSGVSIIVLPGDVALQEAVLLGAITHSKTIRGGGLSGSARNCRAFKVLNFGRKGDYPRWCGWLGHIQN